MVQEKYPRVKGVLLWLRGQDSIEVKRALTDAGNRAARELPHAMYAYIRQAAKLNNNERLGRQ